MTFFKLTYTDGAADRTIWICRGTSKKDGTKIRTADAAIEYFEESWGSRTSIKNLDQVRI